MAVDEFVHARGGDAIEYFPSYDLVMDELRQHETFNNDHDDHLHVAFPTTPNYVINRFLQSHCTEPVIEALQEFRRGFHAFERHLGFDPSPTSRKRALAFVRAMREHRDRVGCTVLHDRIRAAIRRAQTGPLPASALASASASASAERTPSRIDDPAFKNLRAAHERLATQVTAWRQSRRRIVIYGAGRHTEMLLRATALEKASVVAVCDDYPEVDELGGVKVVPIEELAGLKADLVVVSSVAFQTRMAESLAAEHPDLPSYKVYNASELAEAQRWMHTYEPLLMAARD